MSIPKLHRIHLPETDSTNNVAKSLLLQGGDSMSLVTTDYQTAGRGQRGNTWESERGKNLLFTLVLHPDSLPATQQFIICELISVALCEVLSCYTDGIRIKWPNDIYCHNHKLCGILIEHDIEGCRISRTIVGVGVNVNQTHFVSGAPNPISLYQILGHEVDREALLAAICEKVSTSCLFAQGSDMVECAKALHHRYTSLLYRRDILSTYSDACGVFTATLRTVESDGHLVLEDEQGELHRYLFKEVAFKVVCE